MDAGAAGFSFSWQGEENNHRDIDGRSMPTDVMDIEEAFNLARVLRDRDEGFIVAMADVRTSAERVRQALAGLGLMPDIKEFSETTRTSGEAAAAIGCTVAQIAKSVVFRAVGLNRAVLVIASGVNRVDEKLVAAALGDR